MRAKVNISRTLKRRRNNRECGEKKKKTSRLAVLWNVKAKGSKGAGAEVPQALVPCLLYWLDAGKSLSGTAKQVRTCGIVSPTAAWWCCMRLRRWRIRIDGAIAPNTASHGLEEPGCMGKFDLG